MVKKMEMNLYFTKNVVNHQKINVQKYGKIGK